MTEEGECFPLLRLPKYLLHYLMQEKFMTPASIRNFMICCKTVYNAAPTHLRKEYLWHLAELERYHKWNVWPKKLENERCPKCGHHLPRKLKKHTKRCQGGRRCFTCWLLVPVKSLNNHFHVCPSKICIELSFSLTELKQTKQLVEWDKCHKCSRNHVTKRCDICWSVRYCTYGCETTDWPKHKETCLKWSNQLKDRVYKKAYGY